MNFLLESKGLKTDPRPVDRQKDHVRGAAFVFVPTEWSQRSVVPWSSGTRGLVVALRQPGWNMRLSVGATITFSGCSSICESGLRARQPAEHTVPFKLPAPHAKGRAGTPAEAVWPMPAAPGRFRWAGGSRSPFAELSAVLPKPKGCHAYFHCLTFPSLKLGI